MRIGSKGQEEAPIELLIGVAILAFVLIIGFYAYQNVCTSQYEQGMKAAVSTFARNLELVYLGSVGTAQITQVDFSVPSACSANVESIKMLKGSTATCNAQTGKPSCLAFIVVTAPTQTSKGILISEVLDIPDSVGVYNNLGTCGENLNSPSNSWDNWDKNTYSQCWFGTHSYAIKISKTTQNTITLDEVT